MFLELDFEVKILRRCGFYLFLCIGLVHPSESGTIAAFHGEKGDSQLDEKGNVFNTFNLFQP